MSLNEDIVREVRAAGAPGYHPPVLERHIDPTNIIRLDNVAVGRSVRSLKSGNTGQIESIDLDYVCQNNRGMMTVLWKNGKRSEGAIENPDGGEFALLRYTD